MQQFRQVHKTAIWIAAAASASLLHNASGAVINFKAPTTIAGDSDVFNLGSTAYAYDWGNASAVVNNIQFTGTTGISGSGDTNVGLAVSGSGVIANSAGYTTTKTPFASLSSAYKSILIGADYDNHTPGGDAFTVSLNGLTPNHAYATQVWVNDPRPKAGRNASVSSIGGNSVTLNYSATNVAGVPGQYTIGGFVADGVTQSFNVTGGTTTTSLNTQLNALQLRDVTGVWSGSVNGNWDSSTSNFTGGMNFATVSSMVNTVYFADVDGFDNPITSNSINVAPGGITAGNVVFSNNAVAYTLSNSDSVGITGSSSLTKTGTGMLTLSGTNTYIGQTNISAGTLVIASSGSVPSTSNLIIGQGATVVVSNVGSPIAVSVNGLTASGLLNLNNNAIVVHSAALSDINSMISNSFNGGAWNISTGITSSSAANDSNHLTAIGVITNDGGNGTPLYGVGGTIASTFDGANPTIGDVLVKYTYYGDANLDGKVDGSDYSRIDNGYLNSLTGWFNGDFNYDGVVNGSDYTLIDNAFNTQGSSLADQVADPIASFTSELAVSATTAVPEPASLAFLSLGTLTLLRRRNR